MADATLPTFPTLREAAAVLRRSPKILYEPYWKNRLKRRNVGGRLLVPREAVESYVAHD